MRSHCLFLGVLLCAAAALLPGCKAAAPATGPCDAVYRFENVRRDTAVNGVPGNDEWTEIARVLDRYAKEPVPPPKTSNFKKLPRGEVRTCEVSVTVPSVADLSRIEADMQSLASQYSGEKKLDFNLDHATMVYRSNYVSAGLEVTLRGVTQQGFRVAVYTAPDATPVRTTAGRGGAWSVKLASVPENRFVYGFSQDPASRTRTRYFRINVVSMQQEAVDKQEFLDATGVDPDKPEPEVQSKSGKPTSRKTARTND